MLYADPIEVHGYIELFELPSIPTAADQDVAPED